MFVDLTEKEKAEIQAIEAKFNDLDDDIQSKIDAHPYSRLYPLTAYSEEPGGLMEQFNFKGKDLTEIEKICKTAEYQTAYEESFALVKEWLDKMPADLKALREIESDYILQRNSAINDFFKRVEERTFSEFMNDPQKIFNDVSYQTKKIIESAYNHVEETLTEPGCSGITQSGILKIDNYSWKVDPDFYQKQIEQALHYHFDFFKNDSEKIEEMRAIIAEELALNPLVAKPGEGEKGTIKPNPYLDLQLDELPFASSKKPENYIFPVDKVNSTIYNPYVSSTLYKTTKPIALESRKDKRNGKEINVYVRLDYDNMGSNGVQIYGEQLDALDKALMNGILTHISCGNDFFTIDQLRRIYSENSRHSLGANDDEIINHIWKMGRTRAKLDATEEFKRYHYKNAEGIEEFSLEAPLLSVEKITFSNNGNKAVGYHVLGIPPLYRYAMAKGQVESIPVKLLQSPVNKNPKMMALENYIVEKIDMARRIKGDSNKNVSESYRTIFFEDYTDKKGIKKQGLYSVYAGVQATLNKTVKDRCRKQVDKIMKHKEAFGFIKNYKVVKKGNTYHAVIFTI